MNKRILSLMLCFAMLAAMMAIAAPMSAAADGEENKVSIELPYKLNVEKTGEMDPPEETFRFAIGDFGAPNEHTIVRDTIETDGERSYDGMFVFTIDRSFCGNLSEGFAFNQVKGEAEGWTYDETRYYAIPNFADNYDKVAGWTFFKPDGDERPGQENMVEGIAFTNSYAANKPPEEKVSIELPYRLNVEKTGEMDPPKETFKFAIGDFGAPNEHTIVRDTIETDGERSYDGMFVFTIDRSFCGNLSEGFAFNQVKGEAEGWTYDETRYYAIPNFADNYDKVAGWTFFKLDGDERPGQENMVEELAFTNSYYAMKPVVPPSDPETPPAPQKPETFTNPETPPAPRKPESPKTSDGGMMELWLALLFVSGISLAGTTLYSRKKRANDR